MKNLSICLIICIVIPFIGFAQNPESGTFLYLQNAYTKRTSDVMTYLIKECNQYLIHFWDSANADEVLFMAANLYEEEKRFPEAFVNYLKIKFIFPNSDRRNDAVSNLNQIVHNKDERTFSEKRKNIDEIVSQTLTFTNRNAAYYDLLKFVYELNIEDLNEVLIDRISMYNMIYAGEAKNVDQLAFWTGDLYKKMSEWHESILAFQKIAFIAPQSILIPQALFQVGLLQYQETRDYQLAKDTFVSLISAHPENTVAGDAQFYLAELYQEKLDNQDEAVATYRVLVETYPDNRYAVESLKRVAQIMEDKDNFQEAVASYYQIYELYPQNFYTPEALLEIESIYRRKLDNYEKAIETLKLYANQFSEKEDAAERLYDAAELYIDELNNKQAGIDTYHEVINKFPSSKYAERAKEKIEDLSSE
jgi:TolA-binding protein